MTHDLISVIDAATQLQRPKQTVFKIIKRLGIRAQKRRESDRRNQFVAYITQDDFRRVRDELLSRNSTQSDEHADGESADDFISAETGVFYLIQLEPEHDPLRIKVGFAANMADRLRAARCWAPFSKVVKTWPCRRLWEKTAIECVTNGCQRLHTEVFRCSSLEQVVDNCEKFFAPMPPVQ